MAAGLTGVDTTPQPPDENKKCLFGGKFGGGMGFGGESGLGGLTFTETRIIR